MQHSENVYLLIKSLTKAERRYFSLQAGFNRSNSHLLQIFEAIARHGVHTDAALKDWFKDSGFADQLDVLKVHLYQTILSSMRNYHKTRNKQREIRGMVDDLHFLYEKALYQQCRKLLTKAQAAAEAIGYYAIMVDLLDIERMLQGIENREQYTTEYIQQLHEKEKHVVQTLETEAIFKHLGSTSGYLNKRYGMVRSEEALEMLRTYMLHTQHLMPKANTIRSIRLGNYSLMAFSLSTGDYFSALQYNSAIIDTFGDNLILIRENPIGLISAIGNQVIICIRLKQYNDALRLLNRLEALPGLLSKSQRRSKELMLRIRMHVLNYRMGIYLECGWIELADTCTIEIEQFLTANHRYIPAHRLHELHFSLLYVYFIHGNFDKAFYYLQLLEAERLQHSKADLFNSIQIIKLIMHYELGNHHLLPYLVRSVYRLLLHAKQLYLFEQTLIRFIRSDIMYITGKQSAKKHFNKLKTALIQIQTDRYEQPAFIMFDIIAWLDSKIYNKSYAQAIADLHIGNRK